MSEASYCDGDEAIIEVGSTTWRSEADYDENGDLLCICCPKPEDVSPSINALDFIPMDDVLDEPTLDERVRLYEEEREARHVLYSKWCLEAMIELASYSLHTD